LYWAISHLLLNRSSLVLGDFLKTVNGPQSTYNFKCELKGRKRIFQIKETFPKSLICNQDSIILKLPYQQSNRTPFGKNSHTLTLTDMCLLSKLMLICYSLRSFL
jgi:hypothetical protein